MKKKIILLFFILIMLSGCVKSTTTMKISPTKSINFESDFLISTELDNGTSLDKIDQKKLASNGYNISTVKEDGYSGLKVTKRYSSIDRVSTPNAEKVVLSDLLKGTMDDKKLFKVEKSFFKNTYYADFSYRLRSEIFANGGDEVDLSTDRMITLDGEMFYKFILEVPYGTIQNNANEVSKDGKTLTWNLNRSQDTDIKFTFTLLNLTNVYIVGGVGIAVFVIILILVIRAIKKKREEDKNKGPIHVDYDPSIEDKLDAFEVEPETAPEVAGESINNQINDGSFEFKLEEEEKAKVAIVEAAKVSKEVKQQPKFITTNSVDEVVDFNNSNNNVK